MFKIKEIKRLRGDVARYVAQANAPIDADIGQKDHLWMETNYKKALGFMSREIVAFDTRLTTGCQPIALHRSQRTIVCAKQFDPSAIDT